MLGLEQQLWESKNLGAMELEKKQWVEQGEESEKYWLEVEEAEN